MEAKTRLSADQAANTKKETSMKSRFVRLITPHRGSIALISLASQIALLACDVEQQDDADDIRSFEEQVLDEDASEVEVAFNAAGGVGGHDTAPGDEYGTCSEGGDRYYYHPLQQVERLPDGRLPYFDVKRSADGKAYAIGEGTAVFDEGEGKDQEVELLSGIVEIDVRTMTSAERQEKPRRVERSNGARDVLDDHLREALAGGAFGDDEFVPVGINLFRTRTGTLTQRINRRIAAGEVETHSDRAKVRAQELTILAQELAPYLQGFARDITDSGAEVTYISTHAPSLRAAMTPREIESLASHPDVQRISMMEKVHPDSLDGVEKALVYQTRMFWDETHNDGGVTYRYDGDNGQTWDIRAAVLDSHGFRTTHDAFKEGSGSSTRIAGRWDCRTGNCVAVNAFSGISTHGTPVLGTFLGDYRDGQSASFASTSSRERRSAPGGEARAYLYWADRSKGDQKAVYDNIVNRYPVPHMVVSSNSVGSASDCDGEDGKAVDADNVYENGIAYFKSANNFGGPYCNVGPPGEAIGVFTVGGFNDPNSSVCLEKTSPIHPNSGWGGHPSDYSKGKKRSIIDVLGAYSGANIPTSSSDSALGNFSGTSHSTPSVASAAVNLIDQMKNYRNTNFIDDPGVLYAWMLNMADRRNQSGGLMSTRFDHRTGAGNLRMRFVGGPGMDAPWYYKHYEMCIDDGEVYTININGGNTLSGDVDSFRAVAWWYDRRIETATLIDDIDLRLKTTAGATLRSSLDRDDNKERIYYNDIGGKAVKLEVRGFDVTSDSEGCGSNSMRVFVTILVEDDDRDDADGPALSNTCVGVDRL